MSPQGRMLTGLLLLAVVLLSDPVTWPGAGLWLLALACWLLAVSPPGALVGRLLLVGALLFAPWFLLTPWIDAPALPGSPEVRLLEGQLAVPWRLCFRGLGGLLVGVWTASSIPFVELAGGLMALPIPRAISLLIIQLFYRSQALWEETLEISRALRVRGASRGLRTVPMVAAALPRVWMPRIMDRAERVGDAMEVRGADEAALIMDPARWRGADALGMGLALSLLVLVVASRLVLA